MRRVGIAEATALISDLSSSEDFSLMRLPLGIAALKQDWPALCERESAGSFVMTIEWYEATLCHRLATPELVRSVDTYVGNRCTAIIPLRRRKTPEWVPGWPNYLAIPRATRATLRCAGGGVNAICAGYSSRRSKSLRRGRNRPSAAGEATFRTATSRAELK
jgi:hypothetical protein